MNTINMLCYDVHDLHRSPWKSMGSPDRRRQSRLEMDLSLGLSWDGWLGHVGPDFPEENGDLMDANTGWLVYLPL